MSLHVKCVQRKKAHQAYRSWLDILIGFEGQKVDDLWWRQTHVSIDVAKEIITMDGMRLLMFEVLHLKTIIPIILG